MCGESCLDLILGRRTIRRFEQDPVSKGHLETIVNAGRLAPSAANLQPLEFVAVDGGDLKPRLFSCLKWAAYIAPAGNPPPGLEPAAYIVTLVNTAVRVDMFEYDVGAAVQNMTLAAMSLGYGSCWLLSIDRDRIRDILGVPQEYRVDSVLALGRPAEDPVAEDMTDSCRYWKDVEGRLHVPKRRFRDIFHENGFRKNPDR
jgi:nitroreductase